MRSPKPTKRKWSSTAIKLGLTTRDLLAQTLKKTNEELSDKLQTYLDMAKELGKAARLRRARSAHRFDAPRDRRPAAEEGRTRNAACSQMQTEFAIMKSRIDDPQMIEMQVDYALQPDIAVSDDAVSSANAGNAVDARRRLATRKTGWRGRCQAGPSGSAGQTIPRRDDQAGHARAPDQAKSAAAAAPKGVSDAPPIAARATGSVVNNSFKEGMDGLNTAIGTIRRAGKPRQ